MAPMYLSRWIVFYIDINDRFYAGTKKRRRKNFEDEAHSEEIIVERKLVTMNMATEEDRMMANK